MEKLILTVLQEERVCRWGMIGGEGGGELWLK